MNIGERLKIVRHQHYKTQKEVSDAIEINPKTYQAYERGRAETPIRVLIALSQLYGLYSIDLLLGRSTQTEYNESLIIKYREATHEQRKIVDFILHLQD